MASDFVADKDYFADKDGNLVEKSQATTKVVSKGGTLTAEDAAKYGLGQEPEAAAEAENVSEAGNDASGDLESKTKAELLEIAQERGVDVKPSQTKADIITALQGE
jgi:hypothetical protein